MSSQDFEDSGHTAKDRSAIGHQERGNPNLSVEAREYGFMNTWLKRRELSIQSFVGCFTITKTSKPHSCQVAVSCPTNSN